MADYCKQDQEAGSAASEDWMGSSVDPPCFGQSKIFPYKCLIKSLQSRVSLRNPDRIVIFYGKTYRKF